MLLGPEFFSQISNSEVFSFCQNMSTAIISIVCK